MDQAVPLPPPLPPGVDPAALSPKRRAILGALWRRRGDWVPKDSLMAAGWPDGAPRHPHVLAVHIALIRRVLGADYRITCRNFGGYRLTDSTETGS